MFFPNPLMPTIFIEPLGALMPPRSFSILPPLRDVLAPAYQETCNVLEWPPRLPLLLVRLIIVRADLLPFNLPQEQSSVKALLTTNRPPEINGPCSRPHALAASL